MSELVGLLEEADAPESVLAWAAPHGSLEDAWNACARPDHRCWLAAVAGAPMERIVDAAATAFFSVAEGRDDLASLTQALEAVVAEDDGPTCVELAETCEAQAERGPAGYRSAPASAAYAGAARAAALVCRAREAMLSAELSLEGARLDRARNTSVLLGGGVHAFLPANAGPVRLSDVPKAHAVHGALLFVVAACAEACREIAASLTEWRRTDAALVEEELDEIVWQVLVPEDES
jgi:hypothetical protein